MLGKALVHVPDASLNGYVEAIRLRGGSVQPDPHATLVYHQLPQSIVCRRVTQRGDVAFGQSLSSPRAFGFGDDGKCAVNQKLDLDYAVVGYWNA
ncbi:hypothetical protein GGD65_006409 [Bradyrhizobium sp. CIR18]|uniref:hypothetical protein n=1 Tax=Bradyrhizobium sp. CIR18 TaxID=2663839 RepID=UPI0016060DCD|nr:hypothetical protein [Bradyrhizobium sp. CIR18]MBB4365343.1 hypothetical protein [Bradyrhizobium sp. CIR18]